MLTKLCTIMMCFFVVSLMGCVGQQGGREGSMRSLISPGSVACEPLPAPTNRCDVLRMGAAAARDYTVAADILTPEGVLRDGAIHVSDGKITAVGCKAQMPDATLINCRGQLLTPGLINAHDHLTFNNIAPGGDPGALTHYAHCNNPLNAFADRRCAAYRFDRRNEWRKGLNAKVQIPTITQDKSTEALLWNELRHVMAGTTTVAGSGGTQGLVRNPDRLELMEDPLSDRAVRYATFPLGDFNQEQGLTDSCDYPAVVGTEVLDSLTFLPHVAEGIDAQSHNEVLCLSGRGVSPESRGVDTLAPSTSFIHAIAVTEQDVAAMAKAKASVVWSPRSNISLYGNTAPVTLFKDAGVNIALATDWTPSGSINLFKELQCAASYNQDYLAGYFSSRDLWQMTTENAARALGLGQRLGKVAVGYEADFAVIHPKLPNDPYASVINADSSDVVLTVRSGQALYGDSATLDSWLVGRCEAMGEVCGSPKSVCLEKTGRTFAQLQRSNAHSYPLTLCDASALQPSCVPSRFGQYSGQRTDDDRDGDGVPDARDNCPDIFNPPRPMEGKTQLDVCNAAERVPR